MREKVNIHGAIWTPANTHGRGFGGGSGIRTHDTVSRIHAFQASALSHSAIPPVTGSAQYSEAARSHNPRRTSRSPRPKDRSFEACAAAFTLYTRAGARGRLALPVPTGICYGRGDRNANARTKRDGKS